LSLEAKLKQELSANEQRMMLLEQKKQRLLGIIKTSLIIVINSGSQET